uniref:Prolyl 4-hydroxylase alpha subunit Fe(2+) 2OG dioxygenase domain-containing protein n=1 Tax=viral metagenome TaxID=1070528 RepID=A0A6C0BDL1_9ZZZZ
MDYEVIIYCGGKCASSSLKKTFTLKNYKTIHLHSDANYKERFPRLIKNTGKKTVKDLIKIQSKKNVYIIDVYRDPIERLISSFFQNIVNHISSDYQKYDRNILMNFIFKNIRLEDYHPLDDDFPEFFNSFDLSLDYKVVKYNNLTFIKLKFSSIEKWSEILSNIIGEEIKMEKDNLSSDKEYKEYYQNFRENIQIPKSLLDYFINLETFKRYNSLEEIEKYTQKWKLQTINDDVFFEKLKCSNFVNLPKNFDWRAYILLNPEISHCYNSEHDVKYYYELFGHKDFPYFNNEKIIHNKMIKIDTEIINSFNKKQKNELKSSFGEWINDVEEIKKSYHEGLPFEHIIIKDFLNKDLANKISESYPDDINKWHHYNNPIEVKYAYDDLDVIDESIKNLFYILSTDFIASIFSSITDIKLECDPYLHGAGLHMHPRNGRLGVHLDYEIHPVSFKQRSLNIILYLSKDWREEWGGETELWDNNCKNAVLKSPVVFNTAIIFRTNNISWHGVPEKIKCPEGVFRKSFAYYYVTNVSEEDIHNKSELRQKATFVARPNELNKDKLEPFYKIRPVRRITNEDITEHWPEWNREEF